MKTTYWFVSYNAGVLGFGSAFIELESDVFNCSSALSELRRKHDVSEWSTTILYFSKVTEEEYMTNKHM